MKNKITLILVALLVNTSLVLVAQTTPASCPNLDFSQGNFNNWKGRTSVYAPNYPDANNCGPGGVTTVCPNGTGIACNGCYSGTGMPVPPASAALGPIGFYNTTGIVPGRQTIMSTSVPDPFTCNNVMTLPPNEPFCARLGNGGNGAWGNGVGWEVDYLSYSYLVDNTNSLLTYKYAVVFQDPVRDPLQTAHTPGIRPRFNVNITDDKGVGIPNCGKFEVTYDTTIAGFRECSLQGAQSFGGNPYALVGTAYRAWTTVGVDLRNYVGKTITIEFNTWDCGWGGHFGYAYVSAKCDAFKLKTSGCLPSGGVQVSAPDGFSYVWQPGGETTKDIVAYATNPGDSVTVTLTSVTGCKTTLSTKIYPTRIKAKFNVNDSVICVNESVNFSDFSTSSNTSNNAPIPIIQWDWRFGDGQIGSGANVTHAYSTAGTYTAHLVVTNQIGCLDSTTKIITVLPLPLPNFIVTDVCVGQPVIVTDASTVQNGQAITNYTWTFTNPNATSNSQNETHLYSGIGTYSINLAIRTNEGCKSNSTKSVKVWPLPIVNFTANNACFLDSTIFNNLSTFGDPNDLINNYAWTFGDPSPLSSLKNPKHIYQTAGTFSIVLTAVTGKGCKASASHTVQVYPAPSASFIATPICINSPIQFTYITAPNTVISSWNWNFGDNNNNTSTLQNPTHVYTVSALFHPSVTVTTNFGCTNKISIPISIPPPPNVDFNSDKYEGCKPLCVNFINLSFSSSDPINSWDWDFGDSNHSSLQTPSHCYPNAGTYTVSLNASTVNGCKGSFIWNSMIRVYPFPVAKFFATPETTSEVNPEIKFTNQSIDNFKNHWTFGDNGIGSNQVNPIYVYKEPGTYTVWLYVETQHGCKDATSKEVIITPEWSFYIPNAFTPSTTGGINDEFTGYAFNITNFELWIFDRWGVNIFYTNDIKKGWNGKMEGKAEVCKEDVYVWKVKFRDINGGEHKRIGHVTLLR